MVVWKKEVRKAVVQQIGLAAKALFLRRASLRDDFARVGAFKLARVPVRNAVPRRVQLNNAEEIYFGNSQEGDDGFTWELTHRGDICFGLITCPSLLNKMINT